MKLHNKLGVKLGVLLECDARDSFPQIDLGAMPVDTWMKITVPIGVCRGLVPDGLMVHGEECTPLMLNSC